MKGTFVFTYWEYEGKHQKDRYSNERICSVLDCEVNISYYKENMQLCTSGLWRMIELSFLNKKYDHLNR